MTSADALLARLRIRDEDVSDTMDTTEQTAQNAPPYASIEVCGATDCLAMGSGAALLEIEELANEFHFACGRRIDVQRSACLGLCGRGPAVKLVVRDSSSPAFALPQVFTSIDDPQRCAEVLAALPGAPILATAPAGFDWQEMQLLERRAAGMRWDALKVLSRRQPGALAPAAIVEEAIEAERHCIRTAEAQARAERRAARMRAAAAQPTLAPLPSAMDCAGL
jgi:hypothetical protein